MYHSSIFQCNNLLESFGGSCSIFSELFWFFLPLALFLSSLDSFPLPLPELAFRVPEGVFRTFLSSFLSLRLIIDVTELDGRCKSGKGAGGAKNDC